MDYDKFKTRKWAILAKCHDCMGNYVDGMADCEVPSCALYPYNPLSKLEPDDRWVLFEPRMKGLVRKDSPAREARREASRKNLQSVKRRMESRGSGDDGSKDSKRSD